jgi:hypothetical protein
MGAALSEAASSPVKLGPTRFAVDSAIATQRDPRLA